jgi:hypothetical protein
MRSGSRREERIELICDTFWPVRHGMSSWNEASKGPAVIAEALSDAKKTCPGGSIREGVSAKQGLLQPSNTSERFLELLQL